VSTPGNESHAHAAPPPAFGQEERGAALALIELALGEDLGDRGDITTASVLPAGVRGGGSVVARQAGVISGLTVASLLAERMELAQGWKPRVLDGEHVPAGTVIARVEGLLGPILAFERTALNVIGRLSGIATRTAAFVAAVAGTRSVILDTRKTTPGWRLLEKYAVRCGGGANHRIGLYDGILIKDNHLAYLALEGPDPIGRAIERARSLGPPGAILEIEVDSLAGLDRALELLPDIILLDNFDLDELREAVRRRDARSPGLRLEASGGVQLEQVRAIAETGVDRISVGGLTHSSPSLDVALDLDLPEFSPSRD
jgi:nicotinate-nucleotide pyrophosphorylase (carboxylating)